jgi:hypothetical protein
VQKGTIQITQCDQCTEREVRKVLGDPEERALGQRTRKALERMGCSTDLCVDWESSPDGPGPR